MARSVKRPAESFTYVLESDRALPPEQQTEFVLRPMTLTEYATAQDDIVRTVVMPDRSRVVVNRTRQQGVEIALGHIVSVRNFPVGAAKPWPSDLEQQLAYLSAMMPDDVQEIAGEVFRRARVGDEEKNSSLPGHTSSSGAPSPDLPSTTAPSAPETPG